MVVKRIICKQYPHNADCGEEKLSLSSITRQGFSFGQTTKPESIYFAIQSGGISPFCTQVIRPLLSTSQYQVYHAGKLPGDIILEEITVYRHYSLSHSYPTYFMSYPSLCTIHVLCLVLHPNVYLRGRSFITTDSTNSHEDMPWIRVINKYRNLTYEIFVKQTSRTTYNGNYNIRLALWVIAIGMCHEP